MNRAELDRALRQASLQLEQAYGPIDSSAIDTHLQALLDSFADLAAAGRVEEGFLLDPNFERRRLVFEAHFQDVIDNLLALLPAGSECRVESRRYRSEDIAVSVGAGEGDVDRCLVIARVLLGTSARRPIRMPDGHRGASLEEQLAFLVDLPACLRQAEAIAITTPPRISAPPARGLN